MHSGLSGGRTERGKKTQEFVLPFETTLDRRVRFGTSEFQVSAASTATTVIAATVVMGLSWFWVIMEQ